MRLADAVTARKIGTPPAYPFWGMSILSSRRWQKQVNGWRPHFACFTLFVILLFPAAARVFAQEETLELDPNQTRIEFSLGASLHTVHGTFRLMRGTIRFDPETGRAGGLVIVDTTSGNTGNSGRDKKMHKEVLKSDAFPEATFAPESFRGRLTASGDSEVEVHGVLTLLGSGHELTLGMTVRTEGERLTTDTRFVIPYEKWGLRNPGNFVLRVSDKVDVSIHAVGRVTR